MTGDRGEEALKDGSLITSDLSFLMTASHELKSPLALVRQLALSIEHEPDEAARIRMIRQITLTSERALRLTSDLTRSSRLDGGLFELEPINSQQICEEVAQELLPLYRAKNREIKVVSRRRSALVMANRDLLRRILLNFADNALHYAASDKPVELLTIAGNDTVRLAVKDYGPGVSRPLRQQVNRQVGIERLNARPQSSGLGLRLAGQFAEAMQGKIGVSAHKEGAVFYVDMMASKQLRLL